jgi:hypothetical protein
MGEGREVRFDNMKNVLRIIGCSIAAVTMCAQSTEALNGFGLNCLPDNGVSRLEGKKSKKAAAGLDTVSNKCV